jgi:hypothetical protein
MSLRALIAIHLSWQGAVLGLPLFDDGMVRGERYCLLPQPGFMLFGFRRARADEEWRSRLKVVEEEHREYENQTSNDRTPCRPVEPNGWGKHHREHRGGVASAQAKEDAEADMKNIFHSVTRVTLRSELACDRKLRSPLGLMAGMSFCHCNASYVSRNQSRGE